jgi:hypothetical protein
VRPDVLSINEIEAHRDAPRLFLESFLQRGDTPLHYPYHYMGPTNSGVSTGLPQPFDQKGYGFFEGQYGIALFSRFPLLKEGAKSLEAFSWRNLPGGLSCLGDRAANVHEGFPLFSTNFLNVPFSIGERIVHAVLLHASIPVRGPLNKERNGDQLIFLNEYIRDPDKGEGVRETIRRLLENQALNGLVPPVPTYLEGGGVDAPPLDPGGFSLKLDYILPSLDFAVLKHEVFWPEEADWWNQTRIASDHFIVYADCSLH